MPNRGPTQNGRAAATIDVIGLSQALIRCPSVTPADAGALDVLAETLGGLGFTCHRLPFESGDSPRVENLYARFGTAAPNFCFAGHTDVVPVGDQAGWSVDPFGGQIIDGRLYGRGATDMKSAIAAFVGAAARFLDARSGAFPGSISLLITGDEEGPAVNGTKKVLDWLDEFGESIDLCLVGEPTNPEALGDMAKIGRRGSLNGVLTVNGVQGHVAYPARADNPVPRLIKLLSALLAEPLDHGTDHFQPSNLEVTTFDVGNPASNVIPARATARFNIRFNDTHTAASLERWLRETLDGAGGGYDLDLHASGEAFLTPPGRLSDIVANAVESVTGRRPELSTSGGTSDARFIKNVCPVVEFGLVGQTMHKTDEWIALADIDRLTDIYASILDGIFSNE